MTDLSTVAEPEHPPPLARIAPPANPKRKQNLARALKANMGRRKAAARAAEDATEGEGS